MRDRRDVILVTVDSLRADHCGFMGYEGDTTPTLDRLAGEGLSFTNAIAPACATGGSVPAFLTGHHPVPSDGFESDTDMQALTRQHLQIEDSIPERFSRMGYRTGAFTANPWTSRYYGYDELFDDFEDFMDSDASSELLQSDLKQSSTAITLLSHLLNWWQGQDMFMTWEALYDDIARWIESTESPFFLWIFLVDVHVPYIPTPEYQSRSRLLTYLANLGLFAEYEPDPDSWYGQLVEDAYDDTIRYTDAFLDRLLEDVDDPLIAVHADHGEELGEYGNYGHGAHMYEEDMHVPLVVGNGPTDTVTEPFSLLRLGDLLVRLASGEEYDSVISPLAKCRNYEPTYAIRGSDFKYVEGGDEDPRLYRVADGTDTPLEEESLSSLGRDLVSVWKRTEDERVAIDEVATELAESESV